jgi:uncharacterized protein (TIGR03435 family)
LTQDRLSLNEAWPERRAIAVAEKYDIQATAEREIAQADLPRALRPLLTEYFNLAVHREAKELRGYDLVMARRDGVLGPRLRRSSIDCSKPGSSGVATDGRPTCGFQSFPGKATGRVAIADLGRRAIAAALADGRPVEDRTGLEGTFEFDLDWTPDQTAPPRSPDAPPAPPVDPNGPSFVTALREQLGLKLEPKTERIDVVVIDRAERP